MHRISQHRYLNILLKIYLYIYFLRKISDFIWDLTMKDWRFQEKMGILDLAKNFNPLRRKCEIWVKDSLYLPITAKIRRLDAGCAVVFSQHFYTVMTLVLLQLTARRPLRRCVVCDDTPRLSLVCDVWRATVFFGQLYDRVSHVPVATQECNDRLRARSGVTFRTDYFWMSDWQSKQPQETMQDTLACICTNFYIITRSTRSTKARKCLRRTRNHAHTDGRTGRKYKASAAQRMASIRTETIS